MCKTIKQKVKFKTDPEVLYELLTDSRKYTDLTGEKAEISRKVGGTFSVQGGLITGINVDLVPGKRIVQAWRNIDFPEGIFSMAAFTLTSLKDRTAELVLVHRGVPKALIPDIENMWRKNYWEKIKSYIIRKNL